MLETTPTYPLDFQVRDAKAIRSFVQSKATYKSSRYNRLKGEAYDAGNRLARHYHEDRPLTTDALCDIVARWVGLYIDRDRRRRHFEAIANSPANVAARQAAYERLGISPSLADIGRP